MEILLDRQCDQPLHLQIRDAIRRKIRRGELAAGHRLPSSRELADSLGVNRATVVQSYRLLKEDGTIESGVGRGTFVGEASAVPPREYSHLDWTERLPLRSAGKWSPAPSDNLIHLAHAVAAPSLFPLPAIRQALSEALEEEGGELFEYASPAGYEPLRSVLRQRLASRGIDLQRNEILIINGSQQGLDLVARLLLQHGSAVITSCPAFSGALSAFRLTAGEPIGVPLDAGGMQMDALEQAVERSRPRLLYTIPFCHNPTGVSMSRDRQDQLLDIARRYQVPVLEDDWLGELRTSGDPEPIKSRDDGGHVLYLGTASKVLVPGFRIGWLVVPREVFGPLLDLKKTTDLASNLPGQVVLTRLLENGEFDRHVQRLAAAFERRAQLVEQLIDAHFPAEARPLRPHRGMVLWLRLPDYVVVPRIVAEARRRGIEITDSAPFHPAGHALPGLRISYATASEEQLERGITQLGDVLREALARVPTTSGPPLV